MSLEINALHDPDHEKISIETSPRKLTNMDMDYRLEHITLSILQFIASD